VIASTVLHRSPSVLPDISPSRGEISSFAGWRKPRGNLISPLEGEMSGRTEGGRFGILAAAALAMLTISTSAAHACSCRGETVAQQAQRAAVIFVGRSLGTTKASRFERVTTFRVGETLKGSRSPIRQVFHAEGDGGNCGVSFQRGKRTLVLTYRVDGKLQTNLCAMPQGSEAEFRAILKK